MLVAILLPPAPGPAAAQTRFTDATAEAGPDFERRSGQGEPGRPEYFLPEIMGGGVALLDLDRDGDLDLYFVQGVGADRFFENRLPGGGRLVARPGAAVASPDGSPGGFGMGVAVGDADGDGALDLYRTAFGPDRLLLARPGTGGPRFAEAPDFVPDEGWSASAVFCDYDRDGRLDLFVTRYMEYDPEFACFAADGRRDYCGPTELPGVPDLLYRNLGEGRFEEVGHRTGIAALAARGLGVVCHDLTGDGHLDFYVANDTEANHLWVSDGNGGFREEAMQTGLALSGLGRPEAGMGIEIGDADRDGDLDLLLTHFADETNTLYLAETGAPSGTRFFRDGSNALGLGTLGLRTTGFGVALGDWDHDGRLDAAVTNGRVARAPGEPPREPFFVSYAEPGLLLRNTGDRFEDATEAAPPLADRVVGRGLAAGDLDGDGDLDLVLAPADGPARLLRNDSGSAGAWLLVEPRLAATGGPDQGATVFLRTTAGTRLARANRGVSYLSSGDPRAHFGIEPGAAILGLAVRWSNGLRERFPAPEPNRAVIVVRGEGQPDA